jgi:hypothetical protein
VWVFVQSYNFGPRKATDKKCGFAFIAVLVAFFLFTVVEIGINSGTRCSEALEPLSTCSASVLDPPICDNNGQ